MNAQDKTTIKAKRIYNKKTNKTIKVFCPFCKKEMTKHPLGFWCENCKKGIKWSALK